MAAYRLLRLELLRLVRERPELLRLLPLRVERERLVELRLDALRVDLVRLEPLRLVPLRLDVLRELDFRELDFLAGTRAPERRASERPMAMACLRLVTFFFDLAPLLSVPRLRSRIAFATFFCAVLLYFAILVAPFVRSPNSD